MLTPDYIRNAVKSHITYATSENTDFDHEANEEILAQLLMTFTEEERFSIILSEMLHQNPVIAMRIGELCLKNIEYFRELITQGFSYIGSAQINFWIRHSILHLGISETRSHLHELQNSDMRDLALYYFRANSY